MTRVASPNMLNGSIVRLVYDAGLLYYITDQDEYCVCTCGLQMAQRMAQVEGVALEVRS